MIGQPDLMYGFPVDDQWLNPRSDKSAGLNDSAHSNDGYPPAILDASLGGELWRYLSKKLGLKFGQMRQGARHRSRSVMFRQPVCREHIWKPLVWRISVLIVRTLLRHRGRICLLRVE